MPEAAKRFISLMVLSEDPYALAAKYGAGKYRFTQDQVNSVRHLIGTASGWGGNPEKDACYVTVTPSKNDGNTVHRLTVKGVPVDGSVDVQFGGLDGKIPNCLPVTQRWNYWVHLYRPRAEILYGTWKFSEPQPVP